MEGSKFDVRCKDEWFIYWFHTYDYSFQAFQNYNGGSHEITIGFEFAKKENKFRKRKIIEINQLML